MHTGNYDLNSSICNASNKDANFWFDDLGIYLNDVGLDCESMSDFPGPALNDANFHFDNSRKPPSESDDSWTSGDSFVNNNADSGLELDLNQEAFHDVSRGSIYSSDDAESRINEYADVSCFVPTCEPDPQASVHYNMELQDSVQNTSFNFVAPQTLNTSSIPSPSVVPTPITTVLPLAENQIFLTTSPNTLTTIISYSPVENGTTSAVAQRSLYPIIRPKMEERGLSSTHDRKNLTTGIFSHETPAEFRDKQQLKMIKNRQSAYLSRKRQKEYVQSLEVSLKNANAQNEQLKRENCKLRSEIGILRVENERLQRLFPKSTSGDTESALERIKLKIGTPANGTPIKLIVNRKVACLMTVLFFFAVNMGPYWSFVSPKTSMLIPSSRSLFSKLNADHIRNDSIVIGRNLINPADDADFYIDYPSSNDNPQSKVIYNDSEPDILKSKRSRQKRSIEAIDRNHHNKTLAQQQTNRSSCRHGQKYVNVTESLRLRDELNQWISSENDRIKRRFRLDRRVQQENRLRFRQQHFLYSGLDKQRYPYSPNSNGKNDDSPIGYKQHGLWLKYRRRYLESLRRSDFRSASLVEKLMAAFDIISAEHFGQNFIKDSGKSTQNSQNYYEKMLTDLKRRNDTLYMFSFKEYFLLPASEQNATTRPKMSLLMPTSFDGVSHNFENSDNFVQLIEIECEITNFVKWPDVYNRTIDNAGNNAETTGIPKVKTGFPKVKAVIKNSTISNEKRMYGRKDVFNKNFNDSVVQPKNRDYRNSSV